MGDEMNKISNLLTNDDAYHYDRWIKQIKKYVDNKDFEYNEEFIIKLCLSYTLQSLRNGEDLKRFQWGMINDDDDKKRFRLIQIDDYVFQIYDINNDLYLVAEEICSLLNEQQVTIDQLNLAIDDLLSHTSCDEIKKENERLKKRLYLYEISEDEVDKYLRTHPMPTSTNERVVVPLDMRHKRC